MHISLIGTPKDRERFAFEAQTRHGFFVVYSLDEFESKFERPGRFLYFGHTNVSDIDMQRVRAAGTVVFVSDEEGCRLGDFIFRGGRYHCDYSVALRDLVMAFTDEAYEATAHA